ncbi:MAG: PA14 domain-containing protein, partial [Chloroflexota bacterium]|nr:PA14 domain-containing protein [Chloroflexota bacterium]
MFRKLRFPIGFTLVLLLVSTAYAQPPGPRHTDPFWQVLYWNNTTLSGEPVVQTTDAHLDWDWGSGSPHSSISADRFSARWTRYIDVTAGTYRFTTTSDDGIRVYVDNRLVIDHWYDHPARTFTADVSLSAGHHLVVVEYYENMGRAVARLSWAAVTPGGWRGEYFDNHRLNGSPVLVRDDADVDFYWDYGSPAPGIPSDGFSARWTQTVHFEAGSYRFTTTTDDGVRLWVNGHLLIDKWRDQSFRSHSGVIYVAGDVPIKMEYYENGGVAAARLTWVREDGDPPPPP